MRRAKIAAALLNNNCLTLFNWFLLFQLTLGSLHSHPILTGPPARILQYRGDKVVAKRGFFDRFGKKRTSNTLVPIFSPHQANDLYKAHVQYAANAYCPGLTVGSSVGTDGKVLWVTGNGDSIQRVYVAYSPSMGSIIVSHEGTNKSSIASVANDLDFSLIAPFDTLNWLGPGVKIGRGFQEAWFDTALQVLDQVKAIKQQYSNASIVVTGHSLGASTALLGALHLNHALEVPISTIVFGLPRTGNQAFADAVDKYLPSQRHITHNFDPVPHLPARSFGFQHPSGEVWTNEQASVVYQCPGQENSQCSNSVSLLQYEISDHTGPYFGVSMYCVP